MENFESAKASKERANEGGGVGEYTRVSSAYTRTCLFLRIFARTLNIIIKKSYYNFVSLTLSLSHSYLFSTTWTSFSSRDHPRFLCIRLLLSLSLFLSLSFSLSLTLTHLFTSSINYLLYRLAYISLIRKMFIPRLRSCLRLPCTTVASARCFLRWFPSSLCRSLPKSSQPSF